MDGTTFKTLLTSEVGSIVRMSKRCKPITQNVLNKDI